MKKTIFPVFLSILLLLTSCSSSSGKTFEIHIGGYKGTVAFEKVEIDDEKEASEGQKSLTVHFYVRKSQDGTNIMDMNSLDMSELQKTIFVESNEGDFPLTEIFLGYSQKRGLYPVFVFEIPKDSEIKDYTLHIDDESLSLK